MQFLPWVTQGKWEGGRERRLGVIENTRSRSTGTEDLNLVDTALIRRQYRNRRCGRKICPYSEILKRSVREGTYQCRCTLYRYDSLREGCFSQFAAMAPKREDYEKSLRWWFCLRDAILGHLAENFEMLGSSLDIL